MNGEFSPIPEEVLDGEREKKERLHIQKEMSHLEGRSNTPHDEASLATQIPKELAQSVNSLDYQDLKTLDYILNNNSYTNFTDFCADLVENNKLDEGLTLLEQIRTEKNHEKIKELLEQFVKILGPK